VGLGLGVDASGPLDDEQGTMSSSSLRRGARCSSAKSMRVDIFGLCLSRLSQPSREQQITNQSIAKGCFGHFVYLL
jgi:hypothetical protein